MSLQRSWIWTSLLQHERSKVLSAALYFPFFKQQSDSVLLHPAFPACSSSAPALLQQGWRMDQAFCPSELCYSYHKTPKSISTSFRKSLYGQCNVDHSYCWPRFWIGDLAGDGDCPVPKVLLLVCFWNSLFVCPDVPFCLGHTFKI